MVTQTVNGETTAYTWDDQNRLIEAQTGDGDAVTYEYNDENIRVSSTVNGVKTTYLVDSNLPHAQVLEEYQDENLTAKYVHGLDLISIEQNGETSIYLVDGLGSTRSLTDIDGNVVATYDYEAFGNLINSTGAVENNYLFTGEQFDGELEQYYLRDRYYDQSIGRFTRRDTYEGRIFEPITLHKYLYGNANPVSFIDPTGKSSLIGSRGVAAAIFAILLSIATISFINNTTTEQEEDDPERTFFRGTTYFDNVETVANQSINLERIREHQAKFGFEGERSSVVYFSSQYSTAYYYADLKKNFGGGPGITTAVVPSNRFDLFALKWRIPVEVPVPQPPIPGQIQTETLIPFVAMPEFETFARYI